MSPNRGARGPHAIFFVAVTVLLDVMGFGIVIPVLPRLLVELTGKNLSHAALDGGWLLFVYAIVQFVCAPIIGNLSDRFGRRPVLLYSVGSFGIDYLLMGFAPTIGWLFLGRTIAGLSGASFTTAYAFVADVSPRESRAQNFGIVSAAFGIGFILGPAIGGMLGHLGPRAPFFAAAGLSIMNLFYGLFVLPESLPPERRRPFQLRRANPLGTLLQMRRHPEVAGVLAALFLWQVAQQVMPSTWAFYTKYRFGWSEAMIGGSLALAGIMMATSQVSLMRTLVPRWGERRAALIGIAMATLGNLGYATATASWMMFAWLATWLFGAMVMPSTNAYMSHRIPPDAQGELQGATASLYSLGAIVGPPLMTQLFGRFTAPGAHVHVPGAPFFMAALLTGSAGVTYWAVTREPSEKTALSTAASLGPPE
jgi:MFS transporter, DHA1 family, tetracycline resistance protein